MKISSHNSDHRIPLSVPHMSGDEPTDVREALVSQRLSSVGSNVTAFEREFERRIGLPSVALASGAAAIHIGLRLLGVGPGDEVFCPTFTSAASANPVRYLGGEPVFLDSSHQTWNLDPDLLAAALRDRARLHRLPKALVAVDLFGQCADMDPILEACAKYGIPILEDAAEALGATYKSAPAGTLGHVGAFSFGRNKIITTTGGGMLVSRNPDWVDKARFWSTQAHARGIAFQRSEPGYNCRLSHTLAGIGRSQLEVLDSRVDQRRAIAFRYRDAFADLDGISLMPQAPYGLHTNWLSCFLIDRDHYGWARDDLIRVLDAAGVESRSVWKPLHLQPLYASAERYGGKVAEDISRRGICFPSSSSLPLEDQLYVINQVRQWLGAAPLTDLEKARKKRKRRKDRGPSGLACAPLPPPRTPRA